MTSRHRLILAGIAGFNLAVWTLVAWLLVFSRLTPPNTSAQAQLPVTQNTSQNNSPNNPPNKAQSTPEPTASPALNLSGPSPVRTAAAPKPTEPPTVTPSPTPTLKAQTRTLLQDTLPTQTQTPPPPPSPTATLPPTATPRPVSDTQTHSQTNTDRYILVDQDEQMMWIYEKGVAIRRIPVSTGRPVSNAFTPAWQGEVGSYWGRSGFVDRTLIADYIWYLFDGPEGSILIHSVPYHQQGEEKIYDQLDALGISPVSNGCVRISPEDAAWLKSWNPTGVTIEINKLNSPIETVNE